MRKYIILFLMVSVTTFVLSSTVSATSYVRENIDVIFNLFTIMFDDEEKNIDHFVYNDRTYIAAREFANELGYSIGWDSIDRTINFKLKNEEQVTEQIRPYNRAFYDWFFSKKDWKDGFDHYSSGLEPYAERATIAWAMTDYLESEVLMYKATKDPIYLNRVIDVMDRILELRDSEVGRINEYGESPPIWSAGSRYGWGRSLLENQTGEKVVEVLTYGTWEVDTGVLGELRTGNDVTYITILEGSSKNTFKVRIENDRLDFDRTYDNLSLKKEGVILDDNSVKINVLKPTDDLPKFKEKQLIGNILMPKPVKTALLFNPMLELAQVIKSENLNEYYQEKANQYIDAAIKALKYHEGDWVEFKNQRGYYSERVRTSSENIRPIPWNKNLEMGRMSVKLYTLTGEDFYKQKAQKLINSFMDHVEYNEENNNYIWRYTSWDGYTVWEGINYAILDMKFIYEAYNEGIGFTELDMERFLNTFRKNVYKNENAIARRIEGEGLYHREHWLTLAKVNFLSEWGDEFFFYKPIEWIERDIDGREQDVEKLLSIARSVYQKKIIDPQYEDLTDLGILGKYRVGNKTQNNDVID